MTRHPNDPLARSGCPDCGSDDDALIKVTPKMQSAWVDYTPLDNFLDHRPETIMRDAFMRGWLAATKREERLFEALVAMLEGASVSSDGRVMTMPNVTAKDVPNPIIQEAERIVADLRTHAFDDCGEKDVATHVGNVAANLITDLLTMIEAEKEEGRECCRPGLYR